MTDGTAVICPQGNVAFPDSDTLTSHGLDAHARTRQEVEQERADAVMASAMERQQDAQGRREQAGQPGGNDRTASEDRRRDRMNPARPGDDIGQQTQQQQRQVE